MYTLGIDIGSTTSKCILLKDGDVLTASSIVIGGTGTKGPQLALQAVYDQSGLSPEGVSCTIATGYGRKRFEQADGELSELSCHARGVHKIFPDVRTILDIGGQDAKVMALNDQGRMTDFLMNDKCAAGTGRFLDVMAGILQLRVEDLEVEALKASAPAKISNTCTVFAESEVISQLAAGTDTAELVAGICESVAGRAAALVKRIGVRQEVCMSGGVAQNGGVRAAMERALGCSIRYSPDAQLMGALGAALYAYDKAINKGGS